MSAALRTFFGLPLPTPVREALAAARPEVRAVAPRARLTSPENLHLTLLFVGHTEPDRRGALEEALRAVAAQTRPFDLFVRGAGTFGGRRPRVLWAGVEGDLEAAADLASRLGEAAALPLERPWRGHVTLARARPRGGDAALAAAAEALAGRSFGPLPAHELVLFESRSGPGGVRYLPLCSTELAERD